MHPLTTRGWIAVLATALALVLAPNPLQDNATATPNTPGRSAPVVPHDPQPKAAMAPQITSVVSGFGTSNLVPLPSTLSDGRPMDVFLLASRPKSTKTIYLDFTGHTLTGTQWNAGSGVDPIVVQPWDIDGNPGSFNALELQVIYNVWLRVAEDYTSLDVNVTTVNPDANPDILGRSSTADTRYGARLLMTPTTSATYSALGAGTCHCGGMAYTGVFDLVGADHERYSPALVFTSNNLTDAARIAEVASHEAGHNLGLSHDGITLSNGSCQEYYGGNATWGPIMGASYDVPITQFDRSEYAGACKNVPQYDSSGNPNNDDFAVMAARGAKPAPDDYGDTLATAQPISTFKPGKISSATDADVFRFEANAGPHTFTAYSVAFNPDLDIKMTLLDGSGHVVAAADPIRNSDGSPRTDVQVSLALDAGTYYIKIEGSGIPGQYSNYGSRGSYVLDVR